ncbi:MAG TPA: serine hydrolase [Gemmatimonadaceae bacterium]|nr:serine hydrolase [Gemmatimonadaceae bacterium]
MKKLLLLLFVVVPRLAFAQQFISDSALRAIVQERVATKRTMGIVVAVLEKGKPPRIKTAGVSGISGVSLDGNTVFEIGSITKAFTGALLADMVSRGEVKLEDPVSKYLPGTVKVPSRNGKQITLLDLATQSSGLPRLPNNMHPADFNNPYADYSVQQLYDFLSGYTLTRDPGAQYEYSNLGVGLLGHVLALKAGKSYEEILRERILDPLGMNDTRIELTPSMKQRMAQGFDAQGTPTHTWDLPTLAGAGALKSTANDMLKFLAANLDSTSTSVGKALAFAKVARHDADRPGNSIGLAWHIVDVFGTRAIWHNGGTGGFRTFIGMDDVRHRGVIVLTNSINTPDDIGFHVLEPKVQLAAAPGQGKQRTEIAVDGSKLERLTGVYQLAPDFQLTVTREGMSLFAQATGQPKFPLFAEAETEFFLKVVDAQISFVKDPDGRFNSLVLHQGGANIPGKRVK